MESLDLFLGLLQDHVSGRLRLLVLSIIFDILMVFDLRSSGKVCPERCPIPHTLKHQQVEVAFPLLMHGLEGNEYTEMRTLVCIGFCKLLLNTALRDKGVRHLLRPSVDRLPLPNKSISKVVRMLLGIYIAPQTVLNPGLCQALGYFFPAFCAQSVWNQRLLQEVPAFL
jgi:hypothetical protein